MAKRSTGYTPTGKSKSSPVDKKATPMKSPTINMANPMKTGATGVASMPGERFPKLTKPAAMTPRTPRI